MADVDPTRSPQMRVPILMKEVMVPEWSWFKMDNRRARWVQVFARLKPGQTVESAQAPAQALFAQQQDLLAFEQVLRVALARDLTHTLQQGLGVIGIRAALARRAGDPDVSPVRRRYRGSAAVRSGKVCVACSASGRDADVAGADAVAALPRSSASG